MNKPTKHERVVEKIIRLTENGEIKWNEENIASHLGTSLQFSEGRNALFINIVFGIVIPRKQSIKLAYAIQHQRFPEVNRFIDELLNGDEDE